MARPVTDATAHSQAGSAASALSDREAGTPVDNATARTIALITACLAYTIICLFAAPRILRDPDTLWHIRTGQWMLENWQWPRADMFSHTFLGQPWIAKEWISQLILSSAYELGGWHGVVIVTTMVCATTAGVVALYAGRFLRLSIAGGLALITFLLLSAHFLARPHVFGYLFMAVWLFALLQAADKNRAPPLWLAAVMMLWANAHSTFVLGLMFFFIVIGVILLRALEAREWATAKRTSLVAVAVIVAAMITPYGLDSILITWKMMGMKVMIANLIEWQPPNFRAQPIYLIYLVGFILLLAASGMRLCLARLAILGLVGWLGFSYTRGLGMFVLAAPFLIARPLAQQVPFARAEDPGTTRDPVLLAVKRGGRGLAVVSLAIALVATVVSPRLQVLDPLGFSAPRAAVEYARKANISAGRVFNHYDFGGYLIFSGIPTFIDGRAELFSEAFLHAYFSALDLADVGQSYKLLDQYKIDWVLLRPGEPFVNALMTSREWKMVYSDKDAVIFVRA